MTPSLHDIVTAAARPPRRITLDGAREAAVAAIVTPDLRLLFIRRADHPGDPWSGHVSFPGGRREASDPSLLHAAIRETEEEIGVRLRHEDLVGELDDVATPGHLPTLVVRPFVFAVPGVPAPTLNAEVQSVHLASVQDLLDGVGRGPMDWSWRGTDLVLPRVDFDGVRLWGLTLRMVDDLLHRLDGAGSGLDRRARSP